MSPNDNVEVVIDSRQVDKGGASRLRLRPLRIEDEHAVRAAQQEMADEEFEFAFELTDDVDWSAYVARAEQLQRGVDLGPHQVPASFLVATVDDVLVGRTSIRHRLNDGLFVAGGHIGYCVLRPFRRRGLASEILHQSLIIARAFGVDSVLLTCDDGNVGSSTIIERYGGVLDLEPLWAGQESLMRRYWID